MAFNGALNETGPETLFVFDQQRRSDDRDGCLQDAHWYSGYMGGRFQSYAIGNVLSAQFYGAALKAHPSILHEVAKGEFGTLHNWLRDNLYRHSSKFAPNDIVERATGAVMQMRPYLEYLHGKYGALYRLPQEANQALKAH